MHVAVCDDNIADRKQTERLLGRESDRRAKETESLYIDSYGNETALLANPMQYDIFYIDMCKTPKTCGTSVAQKLCAKGVHVPIYMCISEIDYRNAFFPENVFFIEKPLKTNELRASLDHAYTIKQNSVSVIELREEKETHYVTEPDIMYGIASKRHVLIYLTDGRIINIAADVENLYNQWVHYETFLVPNPKIIVNSRYLERVGYFHLYMNDGNKFSLHPSLRQTAKNLLQKNTTHHP